MLEYKLRKALTVATTLRGNRLEAPADARTIEITSGSLQEYRLPPLPDDYRAFLAISNGFVGLNYILRATEPFSHEPPLLAGTIRAILRDELIDKRSIVVGRLSADAYLTYHSDQKRYFAIADRDHPFHEYPDLLGFIEEYNRRTAERLAPLSGARN